MSKKIQEKKAKKPRPERVTLASLNRKVDLLDSRLRTLKAWETMQDAMEESRSAPAEEWPKVGDYVVLTDPKHPQVGRIDERGEFMDGRYGVTWIDGDKSGEEADEMRPATPAEIASHKAKEEQRALEAERVKEMAKPLEFGTRVKHSGKGDCRIACFTADERQEWLLMPEGANATWSFKSKRHEFRIID